MTESWTYDREHAGHSAARFAEADAIQFAYRRFGSQGRAPLVFFNHFTGTLNDYDP
jgi:hypothetical protein